MLLISWSCICPITNPGDTVAVVGTHDQIGAWDPHHSVRLTTDASLFPLWTSKELSFCYAVFLEYKYIVCTAKGNIIWEPFEGNRVIHLNASTSCVVENVWGSKESDFLKFKQLPLEEPHYGLAAWPSPSENTPYTNGTSHNGYASNGGQESRTNENASQLAHMALPRHADVSVRRYATRYFTQSPSYMSPPVTPSHARSLHHGASTSSNMISPLAPTANSFSFIPLPSTDAADNHSSHVQSRSTHTNETTHPFYAVANGNHTTSSATAYGSNATTGTSRIFINNGASMMQSPPSASSTAEATHYTNNNGSSSSLFYPVLPGTNVVEYHTPLVLRNDYTLTDIIGTGSWGVVKAGREHATGIERAVKHIAKTNNKQHMQRIYREIDVMCLLNHPNIVKLHRTYEDSTHVYLVMEYCAGGELFDRLVGGNVYSETLACRTMQQILVSVAHCHMNQIAHRDLKPENFLFLDRSPSSPIKLIDFGLASKCDPNVLMQTKMGTAYYVSPEVIEGGQHGLACDMWSVGVILYMLLCGYPPFHGNTDSEIFSKIADGRYDFPSREWSKVSDLAKDLIRRLLTKDTMKRLTAAEALSHKWFSVMNNVGVDEGAMPHCLTNLNQFRRFQKLSRLKRLALAAISQSINDVSYRRLRDAFEYYDTNVDFMLSKQEILQIIRDSQVGLCEDANLEETFMLLDPMGTGRINYAEFLAACVSKAEYKREEVCRAAFNLLDVNRRGKFSAEEAKQICLMLGYYESDLDNEMREADLDGDGEINFEEFRGIMRKIPSLTHLSENSGSNWKSSDTNSFCIR